VEVDRTSDDTSVILAGLRDAEVLTGRALARLGDVRFNGTGSDDLLYSVQRRLSELRNDLVLAMANISGKWASSSTVEQAPRCTRYVAGEGRHRCQEDCPLAPGVPCSSEDDLCEKCAAPVDSGVRWCITCGPQDDVLERETRDKLLVEHFATRHVRSVDRFCPACMCACPGGFASGRAKPTSPCPAHPPGSEKRTAVDRATLRRLHENRAAKLAAEGPEHGS
jgi:hypothetical protein